LSGQCTLPLNGQGAPNPYEDVETIKDIASVVSLNGSDITVNYVVPSGVPKPVSVSMTQVNQFHENIVLCNQTIVSSAGSITCTANATIGDSQVLVNVDSGDYPLSRSNVYYAEDLGDFFLLNNYAIAAFFIILLVTMMVSSPKIMIVASIISVVLLGFTFLIKGSSIGTVVGAISWLIISGIIILIKLNKKDET